MHPCSSTLLKEVGTMKNYRAGFIFVMVSIFFLTLTAFPTSALTAELPKFITITAYPIGSLSSLLATGFCSAIDKKTGIKARPTPADTDMGRVLPVRKGESQATLLTGASCYVVSNGLQEFSVKGWGPQKIRTVFAGNKMFNGLGVKADSGIKTWSDFKGKKVAMGPGLLSMTVPGFLAYGGLTLKDVVVVRAAGYTAAVDMVQSDAADGCHTAAQSPSVKQWESSPHGLRYLPFDQKNKEGWERMSKEAPFMGPIWADSGALGEGGPKWLAYYPFVLDTYDTVDEKIIYTMVKGLVEGRDIYKDIQKPDSELWTLEETLNLTKPIFTPFHPGLIKYAKEMGKWTAEHEAWQAKALSEEEKRIKAFQPKN
jgi:TRAP transporter TAXI family solute receptor